MSTIARQLSNHLARTVRGPMWHGPALADLLDGVPHARAAARPLPGVHSIWDIVRHITAWAEIVKRRLGGEIVDPTPEQDWPPVSDDGQEAWARALERMAASHRELAAATRELQDAQLDAAVAGQEYPVSVMLNGVVEHGTYHGGQIALLKKA